MSNEKNEKKLNASQRLETLEVNMQEVSMFLNNLARDNQILREAVKLLGNKADAIQKSAGITDDQVAALMIENNANELKEKVDGFLTQGVLKSSETVDQQSFLVGKEVDDEGKVVNKRIQFAVGALQPELQSKLIGAKAGDLVQFTEGTLKLEISEIYAIVTPEQPKEDAPEAAPEA